MTDERTTPDEATEREEQAEAVRDHVPDQPPTEEQEAAAHKFREEHSDEMEAVARHHKEMDDIGANAKGEGRIS